MFDFIKNFFSRVLTVIMILVITFTFLHLVPGGPFDEERALPPEIEANLYKKYGLHKQGEDNFFVWLGKDLSAYTKQLIQFNLGPSLKYDDRDVRGIISEALPASLILGSHSLVLALFMALITGLLLIYAGNDHLEDLFSFMSSLTIAMPSFIRSVLLIGIFALTLKWFPPALWDGPQSMVLPVCALAITPYFLMTELLYNELQKEKRKLYVKTAIAKGLPKKKVLFKHVLKNSMNPLLAILGPMATYLLTGSFVVETIFSIPGLGRHFVLAVQNRDYFLVMGITGVIAVLLIFFNWFTDGVSKKLDPRLS